jgi:hypothetical protein
MKNMSTMGLCEYGNELHRSYTVTLPGAFFYSVRHDILTQMLMKVVDEGKLISRQGATSQMT